MDARYAALLERCWAPANLSSLLRCSLLPHAHINVGEGTTGQTKNVLFYFTNKKYSFVVVHGEIEDAEGGKGASGKV